MKKHSDDRTPDAVPFDWSELDVLEQSSTEALRNLEQQIDDFKVVLLGQSRRAIEQQRRAADAARQEQEEATRIAIETSQRQQQNSAAIHASQPEPPKPDPADDSYFKTDGQRDAEST